MRNRDPIMSAAPDRGSGSCSNAQIELSSGFAFGIQNLPLVPTKLEPHKTSSRQVGWTRSKIFVRVCEPVYVNRSYCHQLSRARESRGLANAKGTGASLAARVRRALNTRGPSSTVGVSYTTHTLCAHRCVCVKHAQIGHELSVECADGPPCHFITSKAYYTYRPRAIQCHVRRSAAIITVLTHRTNTHPACIPPPMVLHRSSFWMGNNLFCQVPNHMLPFRMAWRRRATTVWSRTWNVSPFGTDG